MKILSKKWRMKMISLFQTASGSWHLPSILTAASWFFGSILTGIFIYSQLVANHAERIKAFNKEQAQLQDARILEASLTPEDYIVRGSSLVRQSNYELAIVAFDRALEKNPKLASAFFNKSLALEKLGRNEEAVDMLDKALSLQPYNTEALRYKVHFMKKIGSRYAEALATVEKLIEIEWDSSGTRVEKADILMHLGRPAEAQVEVEKCLRADSSNEAAMRILVEALKAQAKYEEAIAALNKHIAFYNADNEDTKELIIRNIYNRARVYALMGKKNEALADLTKVIAHLPSYKMEAKRENDFDHLRKITDFNKLTD